jgi:hypothetical protein
VAWKKLLHKIVHLTLTAGSFSGIVHCTLMCR